MRNARRTAGSTRHGAGCRGSGGVPYLSERQWGTVREDYSDNGDAWNYFTHDQARSRAYKWGEDGIAGLLRRPAAAVLRCRVVERRRPDPEGADVRPDQRRGQPRRGREGVLLLPRRHADELVPEVPVPLSRWRTSRTTTWWRRTGPRTRTDLEYELIDTGVFDDDRYVDVDVEYAKAGPEDIHIRITVTNRGAERGDGAPAADAVVPQHVVDGPAEGHAAVVDEDAGGRRSASSTRSSVGASLRCEGTPTLLFTENESNTERLWGSPNASPYVKDAFHDYVVHGPADAVNPARTGHEGGRALRARPSRRAAHTSCTCGSAPPSACSPCSTPTPPIGRRLFAARIAEADEFYASITPPDDHRRGSDRDAPGAGRDAVGQAALLLRPRPLARGARRPPARASAHGPNVRNRNWFHMVNDDVISMPDTWEYPWYASWDLAFHTVALGHGRHRRRQAPARR